MNKKITGDSPQVNIKNRSHRFCGACLNSMYVTDDMIKCSIDGSIHCDDDEIECENYYK